MDIINSSLWDKTKGNDIFEDFKTYWPKWYLSIDKNKLWVLLNDINNNSEMKNKLNTYMKYNWEKDEHWKTGLPRKFFYWLTVLYMNECVFKEKQTKVW
jgi:hypothetical protein